VADRDGIVHSIPVSLLPARARQALAAEGLYKSGSGVSWRGVAEDRISRLVRALGWAATPFR